MAITILYLGFKVLFCCRLNVLGLCLRKDSAPKRRDKTEDDESTVLPLESSLLQLAGVRIQKSSPPGPRKLSDGRP